jgi:peroxiredoxin
VSVFLILVRLALAGVFTLAALAKLTDRAGSRKAVSDFGLPAILVGPTSLLLPPVELFVAFLLVAPRSGWWGGIAALALLAVFTTGIVVNLARGRAPDCHCFGQLHSAPIGWATLVRNGLFAAGAGFIIWQGRSNPGSGVIATIGDCVRDASVRGLFAPVAVVVLAVQCWLIFHLFSQHGRLLIRIDNLEASLINSGFPIQNAPAEIPAGLPYGSPAPPFDLPLLSGQRATLAGLCDLGNPVLLIFSEPHCNPCNTLLPDIARWNRDYPAKLTLALISRGTIEDNNAKLGRFGLTSVLVQKDREVAEQFLAEGTPSAVLINSDRSIGSSLAIGAEAITRLVANATAIRPPSSGAQNRRNGAQKLQIGQRAPSFKLSALNGGFVELDDFKGHDSLLLFWNPKCGFCANMLPDIRALELNRKNAAPRILVISTDDVQANRAMLLQSTVLLDRNLSVGTSFGVSGTPSAVLVDSNGKIASPLVVGAPNVLAFMGVKIMNHPRPTNARVN